MSEENHPPEKWSLEGLTTTGKLVRVYDGDTFTLVLPVCCKSFAFSCRLDGVDTPELRTKNKQEKQVAKEARDYVKELLSTKSFTVTCKKFDKYGRVLCDITLEDGELLSTHLITQGYACAYMGGKKRDFTDWYKN